MTDEAHNEDAKIGHNSAINPETAKRLQSIVERVETLNQERKETGDDIKEIFEEAKSAGFDVKAIRKIIATRKRTAEEVRTETGVIETYCRAIGMGSYLE